MLLASGCAEIEPKPFEPSRGHIQSDESAEPAANIPALVQQAPILPEPSPPAPTERYTVVVNEVPVRELLFALARDAEMNIDIYPGITGEVTLNAVDQTMPQILDRISRQVDIRYEFDDQNLYISPDTPFFQSYKVDYVNMSRDTTSSNRLATQ
ncbi:MAG: type II and III secretion system protein, partial [Gammaproteobacteria bacterium]